MAAQKGREILIKLSISGTYTTVGGLRQKSFQLNSQSVDVTDADSAGRWRELMMDAGVRSMSVSGSGIFKDSASENAVLTEHLAGTTPNFQMVVPGLGTFQGAFGIPSIGQQGNHDGEVQFSMSFESAGQITFTAS
jgi:TP901-1 family phage major tail protein